MEDSNITSVVLAIGGAALAAGSTIWSALILKKATENSAEFMRKATMDSAEFMRRATLVAATQIQVSSTDVHTAVLELTNACSYFRWLLNNEEKAKSPEELLDEAKDRQARLGMRLISLGLSTKIEIDPIRLYRCGNDLRWAKGSYNDGEPRPDRKTLDDAQQAVDEQLALVNAFHVEVTDYLMALTRRFAT